MVGELGFIFKVVFVLVLFEDEYLIFDDFICIYNGKVEFYEEMMEDVLFYSYCMDIIKLWEVFEIFFNVGIVKIIEQFYGEKNDGNDDEGVVCFVWCFKQFNLYQFVGLEIEGEVNFYIKEVYSEEDYWSGIMLFWMLIGYELELIFL